jgi:hypothetical protein
MTDMDCAARSFTCQSQLASTQVDFIERALAAAFLVLDSPYHASVYGA